MYKSISVLASALVLGGCLAAPAFQRTMAYAFEQSAADVTRDSRCPMCYQRTTPPSTVPAGNADETQSASAPTPIAGPLKGSFNSEARVVSSAVLATVRPGFAAVSRELAGGAVATGQDAVGLSGRDPRPSLSGPHEPLTLKLDTVLSSLGPQLSAPTQNRLLQP